MIGYKRTLVNPPVSSRDTFAEIDARNAAAAARSGGGDIESLESQYEAVHGTDHPSVRFAEGIDPAEQAAHDLGLERAKCQLLAGNVSAAFTAYIQQVGAENDAALRTIALIWCEYVERRFGV